MKLIFRPDDRQKFLTQLQTIADHYKTIVRKHDTAESYFVFVRSKVMATEVESNGTFYVHVSISSEEDLVFFKQVLGEPISIKEKKLTVMEFASEIVSIPNIGELSRKDILESLEINEKEYNGFMRYIQRLARRPNAPPEVKKTEQLLKGK